MSKAIVNMTPNPLDIQTIHCSQGDTEAREWGFELHNNGEKIDSSSISDQMVFKAYEGCTEEILPTNGSTPTTSPFKGDIKYPQGLLTDQEFLYRESPTESDGLAKITDIKGNTLVWNQLVQNGNFASTSGWQSNSWDSFTVSGNVGKIVATGVNRGAYAVVDLIQGHKYLLMAEVNSSQPMNVGVNELGGRTQTTVTNQYITVSKVATASAGGSKTFSLYSNSSSQNTMNVRNCMLIDLTLLNTSYITDYNSFKSYFPLPYYSYQSTLLPFKGTSIKTVGKNLCDNSTIITGYYTGQNLNQDTNYKTSALIPVFPNTTYIGTIFDKNKNPLNRLVYTEWDSNGNYIQQSIAPSLTTSSNTAFVRVRNFSGQAPNILNDDFLYQLEIGSTPSNYEPYTSSTTNLPISTYFPNGMKSAGNVYDELKPNKAITRVGMVDLGTLDWTLQNTTTGNWRFNSSIINDLVLPSSAQVVSNLACSRYVSVSPNAIWVGAKGIAIDNSNKCLFVCDSAYSTAEAFKSAMSNVYLYYELATESETSFTTASLVTENAEIPLSNEDGVLIGKCTEELSAEPGFIDAKIKLTDSDGTCYSNKLQFHVERSPQ